ncbi:unnamed protein product, partial [Sphagnum compactum]
VYEALSSKNWGASSTLLNEIATESYDYEKFGTIMTIVWNSLDVDGHSWKQIFKALTLIEFLIKNGSERVIDASRDRLYKIRSLEVFNFYEGNVDKGSGVREKSKQIIELLQSNDMIRSEREKARTLRNKFVGISNDGRGSGFSGSGGNYSAGSGSYNDSRDNYSSGRYGGGSSRYTDEEPSNHNSSSNRKETTEEEEENIEIKSKPSKVVNNPTPAPSTSGTKMKVSMKKLEPKKSEESNLKSVKTVTPVKQPEVDLFSFEPDPQTVSSTKSSSSSAAA